MCHDYTRVWDRKPVDEEVKSEVDDDGLPEYLNEEDSDDVEVLTDGGDES